MLEKEEGGIEISYEYKDPPPQSQSSHCSQVMQNTTLESYYEQYLILNIQLLFRISKYK